VCVVPAPTRHRPPSRTTHHAYPHSAALPERYARRAAAAWAAAALLVAAARTGLGAQPIHDSSQVKYDVFPLIYNALQVLDGVPQLQQLRGGGEEGRGRAQRGGAGEQGASA
jgi:hypothetical protein